MKVRKCPLHVNKSMPLTVIYTPTRTFPHRVCVNASITMLLILVKNNRFLSGYQILWVAL